LGLGLALGAFLKCLFNSDFAGEVKALALHRKSNKPKASLKTELAKEKIDGPSKNIDLQKESYNNGAIHILAEMQKEGRLIDFLKENLDDYNDEEIGGSVRSIHEGCKKAIDTHIQMEKVLDQEEESTCRINKDYDAKSIKLTGRVSDTYPMKGSLVHPGWKVKEVKLTQKSKSTQNIIAPAEVEIE
jgi:hypothetical protein